MQVPAASYFVILRGHDTSQLRLENQLYIVPAFLLIKRYFSQGMVANDSVVCNIKGNDLQASAVDITRLSR